MEGNHEWAADEVPDTQRNHKNKNGWITMFYFTITDNILIVWGQKKSLNLPDK